MFFKRKIYGIVSVMLFSVSLGFIAPASTQAAPKFKVIAFFSDKAKTGQGYLGVDAAHINFAHETNGFFPKLAADSGFTYDSTMDWTKVGDSAFLAPYNIVMWLDDQPGTTAEMTGFRKYIARGGTLMCFHVCAYFSPTDPDPKMTPWPWYFDSLLCTQQFNNNTWFPTANQMHLDDTTFPICKGVPRIFTSPVCEWYSFTKNPRSNANIKVIFTLDKFPAGTTQQWTSGDYPLAWVNTKWKAFYTNVGHNDMNYTTNTANSHTWTNATFVKLIYNALNWLAGTGTTPAFTPAKTLTQKNPEMSVDVGKFGIVVSRPGISDFAVSVTDLKGNRIAYGRAKSGVYSDEKVRLGQGVYIVKSTSALGNVSRTLNVQR